MGHIITVSSQEVHNSLPLAQRVNDETFEQRTADIALEEKKEAEAREREKHCPYDKWAQVNLDHDVCLARRKLIRDCPSAMVILEFMMEQADRKNAIICSQTVLSEILGYEKATISKSLKILKERHFVGTAKCGHATVYLLNRQVTWKAWGTSWGKEDCEYGKCDAMVLMSKSEQDEEELEKPIIQSRTPVIRSRKSRKKDSQPRGGR